MRRGALGAAIALVVALLAAGGAVLLLGPASWREALGLAAPPAPTTGSWGQAPAAAEPASGPLIDLSALSWMAWTPETGAFFLSVLAALAVMTGIEILRPGGGPRHGFFGIVTTRGDRLFITLLGSAYILLAWLGLLGTPIWGGVGLAVLWGVVVFWRA